LDSIRNEKTLLPTDFARKMPNVTYWHLATDRKCLQKVAILS